MVVEQSRAMDSGQSWAMDSERRLWSGARLARRGLGAGFCLHREHGEKPFDMVFVTLSGLLRIG